MALNLFGSEVSNNNNSPVVNSNGAMNMNTINSATPSTMIDNKDNNMNATTTVNSFAAAFENARVYDNAKKERVAAIVMTEAQIDASSPRYAFEKLLWNNQIGVSRAANASREQAIPVVFANNIQWDQLGRALAMLDANIYEIGFVEFGDVVYITMTDKTAGEQHRVAVGRKGGDGKVYYQVHFAEKKFNDRGEGGLVVGEMHPITSNIAARVAGYNSWVDAHNLAVKHTAMGVATAEQTKMLDGLLLGGQDANQFVQTNTLSHINGDAVVNKYQLLAWLLLDLTKPAFEIFTRAKSAQTFELFANNAIEKMTRAYRNELKKLAGLVNYETVAE